MVNNAGIVDQEKPNILDDGQAEFNQVIGPLMPYHN